MPAIGRNALSVEQKCDMVNARNKKGMAELRSWFLDL